METTWVDVLTRALNEGRPRRGLLALIAGSGVTWLGLDASDAKKKRKKKKKCGKPGKTPVKGKCCAGSILVDGACQRCDVCQKGCAYASIQEAIDDANSFDTIAICPGTYQEDLLILTAVRLIGAGAGAGVGNTILQGTGENSVVQVETGLTLENLRVTGGRGDGGGLNNNGAEVQLFGCVVSGNTTPNAGVSGGIRNNNKGLMTLRNTTVSENTSPGGGQGGGIHNATDSFVEIDATSRITGNTATNGGGIYNQVGTVILASTAIVTGNTPNNCSGNAVTNCID